jgi:hypothetical protein
MGIYGFVTPLEMASITALVEANDFSVFDALLAMGKAWNVRFMINLPSNYNLWKNISKIVMEKADAILGSAVYGYELGNEPSACELDECHWFWWMFNPVPGFVF